MTNVTLSVRVVKPIKDAARAVKGTVGCIVRKFKEFTISHLLDLPEFVVVGCEIEQRDEQEIVHLYCVHPHEAALCPYCRQISSQVHERTLCARLGGVGEMYGQRDLKIRLPLLVQKRKS